MRVSYLLVLGFCLTACSGIVPHTVTYKNPVSAETGDCPTGLLPDINLWSKFHSCAESYEAKGWIAQN